MDTNGRGWVCDNLPTEPLHFRLRNECSRLHLLFRHKTPFPVLRALGIKVRPRRDPDAFGSDDVRPVPDVPYHSGYRAVVRAPRPHPVAVLAPLLKPRADQAGRRWWNGENGVEGRDIFDEERMKSLDVEDGFVIFEVSTALVEEFLLLVGGRN